MHFAATSGATMCLPPCSCYTGAQPDQVRCWCRKIMVVWGGYGQDAFWDKRHLKVVDIIGCSVCLGCVFPTRHTLCLSSDMCQQNSWHGSKEAYWQSGGLSRSTEKMFTYLSQSIWPSVQLHGVSFEERTPTLIIRFHFRQSFEL